MKATQGEILALSLSKGEARNTAAKA